MVGENYRQWDRVSTQVELAYNNSPNKSTSSSPFQILYGMHTCGVHELWDLGKLEHRNVNGEDFARAINNLHEQVKLKLQDSSQRYKQKIDFKMKEVQFNIGDLVLTHLRKERFPKAKYNKLKWKKIEPCRILWNFSTNAYEMQLTPGIGISPIFNVAYLYPYIAANEEDSFKRKTLDTQNENNSWIKQIPPTKSLEIEQILDTQVARQTRRK